jgi:hypothetical protein
MATVRRNRVCRAKSWQLCAVYAGAFGGDVNVQWHFAIGFGAKKYAPHASLASLLTAPLFSDLLWPPLLLLGWERVRLDPGNTKFTPLDLVSYPWSHSLLRVCCVGHGVCFSLRSHHALSARHGGDLDRGDEPLGSRLAHAWPGHAPVSWPTALRTGTLELDRRNNGGGDCDVWGRSVALCARDARPRPHWAVCIVRVCRAVAADLCRRPIQRPPASAREIAWTGLIAEVILLLWAWWFDRHRLAREDVADETVARFS